MHKLQDLSNISAANRSVNLAAESNITGTTNHHIDMLNITKVGIKDSSMILHALHVGEEIDVISHNSGILAPIEQAWIFDDSLGTFLDSTAAFNSSGTNISMFVEDNDIVYVGKDTTFGTVDFILDTGASGAGIAPTFEYFNGVSFTVIAVTDNTNGMRSSGSLTFTPPIDWGTNSINTVTKFWFRITRTRNSLGTVPIENLVTYASTAVFSWDEDGDLDVNSVKAAFIDAAQTIHFAVDNSGSSTTNKRLD